MNLTKNASISEQASRMDDEIIRILKARGKIKTAELSKMIGFSKSAAENAMKRMQEKHLVHIVKEKRLNVWHWGTSQTTTKYKTIFAPKDKDNHYTGEKWEPSVARPGCEDFLKCPSRYGEKLVKHRPMMHGMTSSIRQPSQFDR